jgi:hypothetical protein
MNFAAFGGWGHAILAPHVAFGDWRYAIIFTLHAVSDLRSPQASYESRTTSIANFFSSCVCEGVHHGLFHPYFL